MKTETVHIDTASPYDVLIGSGLLSSCGQTLIENGIRPCAAAIIADETVYSLYGETVRDSLLRAGFGCASFSFAPGEENKTPHTLIEILEFLGENDFSRSDIVVALGGGVTGDVAGFAAAVYMRGIRCVQLPTTLLAAVDSSAGGKTAVDLKSGKNLAGCFCQPALVLTDTDVLTSLPEKLLREGAAEIIKYGLLYSEELFDKMCAPDWRRDVASVVRKCVSMKRDAVTGDERDLGKRRLLNLGHTFAHAIETASAYRVSHGEAVAIGLVLASALGNPEVARRVIECNRANSLPVRTDFNAEILAKAALRDKKRRGDSLSFIIPERVGLCREVSFPVSEAVSVFERALREAEALL